MQKWGYESQKDFLCGFCTFDREMTIFSYDFFELHKFSKISNVYHVFILFYRIINYCNSVNKRVVDEYFDVLDLKKTLCPQTLFKISNY